MANKISLADYQSLASDALDELIDARVNVGAVSCYHPASSTSMGKVVDSLLKVFEEVGRSGGRKVVVGLISLDTSVIISLPFTPVFVPPSLAPVPFLAYLLGLSITHNLKRVSPLHTFFLSYFRMFSITEVPSALS